MKKLSELIREGAKRRPQGFEVYFDNNTNASCAIGAALEAYYLPDEIMVNVLDARNEIVNHLGGIDSYYQAIDTLAPPDIDPPHTPDGKHYSTLQFAITYLNDSLKMSREEIASWLESQGF